MLMHPSSSGVIGALNEDKLDARQPSRIRLDDLDAAPMLNDGPIAILNVEDCSLLPLEYNSIQLSGCRGLDADCRCLWAVLMPIGLL
ncbi:hypothetical protein Nepgr_003850 [Nepenthes gracilis]|uniref:Uncharacterized protein n=1 Tax=Nepenthes gracilis TaxID=150966 RepID=A0AAD3XEJ6_NEPGR|nr:hypothetical protein Nepgr_003850 [Nepenthes gracilis]